MSTLSSANVTDVNLVLKERTHMRLCLNMLIFTHNLDNWLMSRHVQTKVFCRHKSNRKSQSLAMIATTVTTIYMVALLIENMSISIMTAT